MAQKICAIFLYTDQSIVQIVCKTSKYKRNDTLNSQNKQKWEKNKTDNIVQYTIFTIKKGENKINVC